MADDAGVLVERLAASLAHAAAAPLSLVTGRAELLARDADSPAVRERVQKLLEPVRRVVEILERAQSFGRALRGERRPRALLEELRAVETLVANARKAGVTLVISAGGAADFEVGEGCVAEPVAQLITFLAEGGGGGTVRVTSDDRGVNVELEPGPGVTIPSTRHGVFDPWLEGPLAATAARMALALAAGLCESSGGQCERRPQGEGSAPLTLIVPFRR